MMRCLCKGPLVTKPGGRRSVLLGSGVGSHCLWVADGEAVPAVVAESNRSNFLD